MLQGPLRLSLRVVAVAVAAAAAATLVFAGAVFGDVLPSQSTTPTSPSPIPSAPPTPLPADQQPVLSSRCVPGETAFNVVVKATSNGDFFTNKSGTVAVFHNLDGPDGRVAPVGSLPWQWEPDGTLLFDDVSFPRGRSVDGFWVLSFDDMPQVEPLSFWVTGCDVSTPPSPTPPTSATGSTSVPVTSTIQPGLPNTGTGSS